MSDLIRNPEDRVSHVEAHIIQQFTCWISGVLAHSFREPDGLAVEHQTESRGPGFDTSKGHSVVSFCKTH